MTEAIRKTGAYRVGPCRNGLLPAVLGAAVVLSASARTTLAEGVALTFGAGLRTQSDSNLALAPTTAGTTTQTKLNLSFGLSSETAQSKLTLQATTGFVLASSGPGRLSKGLSGPGLTLNYERSTANASFTLDGSLSEIDLATNPDVTDFTTGNGQRRTGSLSTSLNWGNAGPLGFGLNAGVSDVTYHNTTGPVLIDHRTTDLGATARADVSAVLHLNLGLTSSRFTQSGVSGARDTTGLSLGATLDRPTGTLGVTLTSDHTPDGQRNTLDFSHQMTLPAGKLSYNFGASQGVTGKTYATGGLTYARDLPEGAVNVTLNRAVQANADTNAETLVTNASLGYRNTLTPNGSLGLALNWASQRNTATGITFANTSLSATWTQTLPQDWALDLGYTHRMRDLGALGTGESNSLFVELRRTFNTRP